MRVMSAPVEPAVSNGPASLSPSLVAPGQAPAKRAQSGLIRQAELLERVKAYDPDADEALLNKAYVYAMTAHGQQLRASGDPYFAHPLEVAGILADLKLDVPTIVTALLHDTIEDTHVTYEDVMQRFGREIAELVDGVTKLSKLEVFSERTKQAENFRKLMLAMSNDIRVLLVKLADRLHNMRTLEHVQDAEKRRRIAQETLDIYAPLAGRIGMQNLREELEDLAFAELNAEARNSIVTRLARLDAQSGERIGRIAGQLRRELAERGVDAAVQGRAKRPYSIWRKLKDKQLNFEALSDIFGFPRHRQERRGLLSGARRPAYELAHDPGAVQGLRFQSQDERLSLDSHHRRRSRAAARGGADSHRADARRGGTRCGGALAIPRTCR